jgi:hypothetical protein
MFVSVSLCYGNEAKTGLRVGLASASLPSPRCRASIQKARREPGAGKRILETIMPASDFKFMFQVSGQFGLLIDERWPMLFKRDDKLDSLASYATQDQRRVQQVKASKQDCRA